MALHYPKIPSSRDCPGGRCVAFEKYDGTNLHWDWDRDFGWHAFGTRRDEFQLTPPGKEQFHATHAHLDSCDEVFARTLAKELQQVFETHPNYCEFSEIKVFTEFLGPGSFAGRHLESEKKELRLFDVWLAGYGFVGPTQFVEDFRELPSARAVYQGKFTGKFADDVREGRFDVREGVVCKGGRGGSDLWMAKIKTNAYMQALKKAFAEKWEQYWE